MSTENQVAEWKESWRDEYLKWIAGFANAEGGILTIGRNDAGTPVGAPHARRLLEELPNKIRDVLGIMADVCLIQDGGHDLVEIRVDPYEFPVSYKGQYHYRSGSTKQELNGAGLHQFLLSKLGRHWDGVPFPNVAVSDLNSKALDDFRVRAKRSNRFEDVDLSASTDELLERLRLTDDSGLLKRAAVLLFHTQPDRFVTAPIVKIGAFNDDTDLRSQDEVAGPVFLQPQAVLDVLKAKYLKNQVSYAGSHSLQRVETWPIPDEALREALLNAIVHKDYASGVAVQIKVLPDQLSIWNPGRLPSSWTIERLLKAHPSLPFNPDLANTFFRAGLIETWGRGIDRIVSSCLTAGLPPPSFETDEVGLCVTFYFTPSITPSITPPITLEGPQQKILARMEAEPTVTMATLATLTGLKIEGVKYHIDQLKAQGYLQRKGPSRGGQWQVIKGKNQQHS